MASDKAFEPIPPRLDLLIKFAASIPACAIVAVSVWLLKLIGMPPLTLLIAATAIASTTARCMVPLAVRLAPAKPGFLCTGRVEGRLGKVALLTVIAVVWVFEYIGARVVHAPHPGTSDDPLFLEVSLAALLACWHIGTLRFEVAYRDAATSTRAGRKAGRDGTTAVVLVHGVGNQWPGKVLRPFARSIEQVLYRQAPGQVRVTDRSASGGMPAYIEFGYTTRAGGRRRVQRVVLLEAFWADLRPASHGLRTFSWFVLSLPLLLLLSIAPDHSDAKFRSLRRILYRISYVILMTLSILQPSLRIFAVALLLIVFVYTVFLRTNLVGDVRLAAANEEAVEEITGRINDVIDQAFSMASKVVLIGHSQGGYLGLRAIRARGPASAGRLEFVGVGSGLKPIWLLHEFGRRSFIFGTSLLLGIGMVLISLIPIPVGLIQYESAWFQVWLPEAVKSLLVAPHLASVHAVRGDWRLFIPISLSDPLAPVPDLWQSVLFVAGAMLVLTVRWQAVPHLRRLQHVALKRPDALRRWIEISTSVDSVGRLAFPRLSGAEIYESTGLGNPLLDHISYFWLSSPTTWFISAQLFPDLLKKSVPTMRQWAHYLNERTWRDRSFTSTLGLLVLTVYVFDRLAPGGRGLHALTTQMRHPGWTFAAFLGLTVLLPILGIAHRVVFARATMINPMESPTPIKMLSPGRRIAIFWAWFYCAAWVGVSGRFLVPYSNTMSPTELRLLPISPNVLAVTFFTLAAALQAGYRPSWRIWVLTFSFCAYWETYLPGRGGAFSLMLGCYGLTAGVLTGVLLRNSPMVGFPDYFWPTQEPGTVHPVNKARP